MLSRPHPFLRSYKQLIDSERERFIFWGCCPWLVSHTPIASPIPLHKQAVLTELRGLSKKMKTTRKIKGRRRNDKGRETWWGGGVQRKLEQMGSQYDYASFSICIKLSKNKNKSLKTLPVPSLSADWIMCYHFQIYMVTAMLKIIVSIKQYLGYIGVGFGLLCISVFKNSAS